MTRKVLFSAVTACVLWALPQTADACGGTFCDGPGMPVDQTGENILFVIDATAVEAHIQIQYDPDSEAAEFAWLIPLTAVPEFSVGSDPLFQALLQGTVPTYGLNNNFCSLPTSTGGAFLSDPDAGSSNPGPDIVVQEVVGAFEVTVLTDDSAADLMMWLGDNGYTQDPEAEPILQEYLDEGHLFAAFKLHNSAEVSDIHPVVLRFDSDEACVPLRLTRIAAAEDMDVRAFFLGNNRTVPTNYRHVLVNPLKLDWLNFADNYKEVITLAVDAFMAEGRAFVTEYAGTSAVVNDAAVYRPQWDASAFVGLPAIDVVETLQQQQLMQCGGGECFYAHPLIEGLVGQHVPVPDGLEAGDFYECLECFEELIDTDAWGDGSGFSLDLDERVIAPGMHAVNLLETWPYLTRMYTTISGHEMTVDPMFHQNPSLPDVPNIRTAVRDYLCDEPYDDGDSVVTLPDGREVFIPDGDPWPEFPDEMPWELEVQAAALEGAPQVLVDNAPIIDSMLEAWNAAHNWPAGAGTTGGESGTDTGGTETTAGSGDPGGPWTTGGSTGTTGVATTTGSAVDGSGCACTSQGDENGWALLSLAGLLGLLRSRRGEV